MGSKAWKKLVIAVPFLVVRNVLRSSDVANDFFAPMETMAMYQANMTRNLKVNTIAPVQRYDTAGLLSPILLSRSHSLPCIPSTRSIPKEHADNLDFHLKQRRNTTSYLLQNVPGSKGSLKRRRPDYNSYLDFRTLYLYNPSIQPIATSKRTPSLVRYVATFRAYLGSNCFGPSRERVLMKTGEQASFLGVALLDESLDIVHNILIDINAGPLPDKTHYWDNWRQYAEDCRVFGNDLDELLLVCNAILFPIRVLHHGNARDNDNKTVHVYPNIYGGSELQVALTKAPRWVVNDRKAKNLNLFQHKAKWYVQVHPLPHYYRGLEDDESVQLAPGPLPDPSFVTPDTNHTIRSSAVALRRGHNKTVQEHVFFPDNQDRGTACCIEVDIGTVVMVGISHTKLRGNARYWKEDPRYANATYTWNRYVSRFVAYETSPPFRIVACSGWFCLPYERSLGGGLPLDLFDTIYDCPAIHFPSGIAESADNASQAIIAYGINDCYPRIIVVEKAAIKQRLRPNGFL